jgi:hypothetical protein
MQPHCELKTMVMAREISRATVIWHGRWEKDLDGGASVAWVLRAMAAHLVMPLPRTVTSAGSMVPAVPVVINNQARSTTPELQRQVRLSPGRGFGKISTPCPPRPGNLSLHTVPQSRHAFYSVELLKG